MVACSPKVIESPPCPTGRPASPKSPLPAKVLSMTKSIVTLSSAVVPFKKFDVYTVASFSPKKAGNSTLFRCVQFCSKPLPTVFTLSGKSKRSILAPAKPPPFRVTIPVVALKSTYFKRVSAFNSLLNEKLPFLALPDSTNLPSLYNTPDIPVPLIFVNVSNSAISARTTSAGKIASTIAKDKQIDNAFLSNRIVVPPSFFELARTITMYTKSLFTETILFYRSVFLIKGVLYFFIQDSDAQ